MGHENPVNNVAKSETQTMNATFGEKNDFDSKLGSFEESILNHSNLWNSRNGNGNSGMDAVAQSYDIDKTHDQQPPQATEEKILES